MSTKQNNSLLLAVDASQTPLLERLAGDGNRVRHSPYGTRSGEREPLGQLGFNGELRERPFGWYYLGLGHRLYNPVLRRFHSPDALSPFRAGGVNAYAYCLGDPVNFRDPTGRHVEISQGLGFALHSILQLLGIASLAGPRLLSRAAPGSFWGNYAAKNPDIAAPLGGLNAVGTAVGVLGSMAATGVNALTARDPQDASANDLLLSALGITIGVSVIKAVAHFTPRKNFSSPWEKKFATFIHGRQAIRAAGLENARASGAPPSPVSGRGPTAIEIWESPADRLVRQEMGEHFSRRERRSSAAVGSGPVQRIIARAKRDQLRDTRV